MPKVYNRHHRDAPSGAVFVGRPTRWGNPFRIGDVDPWTGEEMGRGDAVAAYRRWIMAPQQAGLRAAIRRELRGKSLVCFCAPRACHADTLLEIANGDE